MTTTTGPRLWTGTEAVAAAVAALDRDGYGRRSLSRRQWLRLLRRPSAVVVGAGPVEQPAAVAVVVATDFGCGDLLRLAVRRSERRRGLGRLLVQRLGERLRLRLREDNRAGLEWAVAVGFRVHSLDRGGFGDLDAVVLERERTG